MPRFLVISYKAGTYGNFISQQFLRLAPELFSVKQLYDNQTLVTQSGNRYYHNMKPWLGNTFYFSWATCRWPDQMTAEQIAQQVSQDPDYDLLDKEKYNIVFTHGCSTTGLTNLKTALPESTILKITYTNDDVDWIADRFVDIVKYIDYETDQPIITVDQHRQTLLKADRNCNGCIEFPIGQRENTTYIEQLINTQFR
jgi:hypothetical protein